MDNEEKCVAFLLSLHAATAGVEKCATRSPRERQRFETSCWKRMRTLRSRESLRDAKLVRASLAAERWKVRQQPVALHSWRRSSRRVFFSSVQWCGISCRLVSCKLAPSRSHQSSRKPRQAPGTAATYKPARSQHRRGLQPARSKHRRCLKPWPAPSMRCYKPAGSKHRRCLKAGRL